MPRVNTNGCASCRFWVRWLAETPFRLDGVDGDVMRGACHRRAPSHPRAEGPSNILTSFPMTYSIDWCGEHETGERVNCIDEENK